MRFLFTAKNIAVLLCVGLAALVTGCKTIDSSAAAIFATSVTTVKTQADAALSAAATLTRTAGETYVATQPTLKESDFAETPSSDIIIEWDNTLSAIETYASMLAALSSPNATAGFDSAATNLFSQFTQTADRIDAGSLKSSSAQTAAGLSAAFTEAAHLIMAAKAQATAKEVAQATDPQIEKILNILADEIGDDQTHTNPCLRTTIYRTWNLDKDALTGSFLRAADLNAKKAVAQQYSGILAQRAAEDEALADLRHSLLALADAHHALAQGDAASVQSTLTVLSSELQRTQDLYSQFNADLKIKN